MVAGKERGFEQDILDQPAALETAANAKLPDALAKLDLKRFERIILTGMGSSDYAGIPLELTLAERGFPVWRLQASRLLETPQLLTARTLLIATSQSGRSGEIVALLQGLPKNGGPTIVSVTNDPTSPLAQSASHLVSLNCGSEATVSTKSYLNTLAMMARLSAVFCGNSEADTVAEITAAARSLQSRLMEPVATICSIAERAVACGSPRFALVASGADAASALTGALIMKEASKVSAEGYIGGEFRHGPMELAGKGLTALLLGGGPHGQETLKRLAKDLAKTGSTVIAIAPEPLEGAEHLPVPRPEFGRLVETTYLLQALCVETAKASGIVPGEFRFGQKITAVL